MTKQLKLAMKKAETLSDQDQLTIAAIIEAELADEKRWRKRFQETPNTLSEIAKRAKQQYDDGLCGDL